MGHHHGSHTPTSPEAVLLHKQATLGKHFEPECIVEQLVLPTIYVLNKEILQFLGLKSAVYNQEQFQIKSGL